MSYSKLKAKGIHHVCVRVYDLEKAMEFYKNVFDARIVCEWGKDEDEDHAYIMDLGEGDFLEIFNAIPPEGYKPGEGQDEAFGLRLPVGTWQHLAVWTDNITESIQKAVDNGATPFRMEARRSDIPTRSGEIVHMKCGFVRAPGGELVEFIEDIVE